MLTLLWNDFEIAAACGGVANCGTCHVYVDEAWLDHLEPIEADEQQVLDNSAHRRSNSRLSCQIRLVESIGGMRLSLAPEDD